MLFFLAGALACSPPQVGRDPGALVAQQPTPQTASDLAATIATTTGTNHPEASVEAHKPEADRGVSMTDVLMFSGALWALGGFRWPSPPQPEFSAPAWKAVSRLRRHAMAQDYLRTHDVTTMSLADVVVDLGPPDALDNWWVYTLSTAHVIRNGWGHTGREFNEHPELVVHFSIDQRAIDIAVQGQIKLQVSMAFQPVAWRALAPEDRPAMVNDLLSRGLGVGLNKGDLEGLLGSPEFKLAETRITYTVALTLADTLVLEFKARDDGQVTSAAIRQT